MATMVSIHAPAWGATITEISNVVFYFSFNPRTRVGCDVRHGVKCIRIQGFQSTHPRGVRLPCVRPCSRHCRCFNPRTRVGCDDSLIAGVAGLVQFQSTHPRGVRQPRTAARFPESPVSIHAPAWGATQTQPHWICWEPVSIHAPAWGATYSILTGEYRKGGFNPRTRVGCDQRS